MKTFLFKTSKEKLFNKKIKIGSKRKKKKKMFLKYYEYYELKFVRKFL